MQQALISEIKKSPATIFDNLIVQPLAPPFSIPNKIFLIVIDGLDEVTKDGRNELAQFLAEQFPRTPSWLRLLITSRPEPEVLQPLQDLNPYFLDANLPENLNDIRTYINYQFPSQYPLKELSINTILEKSEGLFLYVKGVLLDLRDGELSFDRLNELPKGLAGKFFQFFTRRFSDITLYHQKYRPLLEMIIAAKGPLPLKLGRAALNWGPYDFQINSKGEACGTVVDPLSSIFPCKGGYIQPFHQSITNWLTDPKRAGNYCINKVEGQKCLADVCWDEYKSGLQKMSPYSLAHLATHLVELERWDDLLELVANPKLGLIANLKYS
jgi:hypothetical protein